MKPATAREWLHDQPLAKQSVPIAAEPAIKAWCEVYNRAIDERDTALADRAKLVAALRDLLAWHDHYAAVNDPNRDLLDSTRALLRELGE